MESYCSVYYEKKRGKLAFWHKVKFFEIFLFIKEFLKNFREFSVILSYFQQCINPKLFIFSWVYMVTCICTKVISHTLYCPRWKYTDIILQLHPGTASLVEDLEITHRNIYRYGHQFIILSFKRSWYTFITMLERSCYC